MLSELFIKNVAIVEEQSISFGAGLNVISGETGSGKSVVLEALGLVLGDRASTDLIRTGADALEVRALFDLSSFSTSEMEALPDIVKGDIRGAGAELLISRIFNSSGKGRVYINGSLASVALLQQVTAKLMSICSQNDSLQLLDPRFHLLSIDRFADNDALLARYSVAYEQFRECARRLAEREALLESGVVRKAQLVSIIEELEPLEIRAGVRDELEMSIREQGETELLMTGINSLVEALNSEQGALCALHNLKGEIKPLLRSTSRLGGAVELLDQAVGALGAFEHSLQELADGLSVDEDQLNLLRERLAEIARLERKYRTNDTGLVQLLEESKRELEVLDPKGGVEKLREEEQKLRAEALKLAYMLRERRKAAGKKLIRAVEQELGELNMGDARLKLEWGETQLHDQGCDKVEILISTNKGESARPLRQIASGGELSRLMLVLKKVLRDRAGVQVLIFDEVDTGISGSVARAVGEKLLALAADSQVICITHLPQVASLADRHILVKKQGGKRVQTLVKTLEGDEKVEEIARMIAGWEVTETARNSARELLRERKVVA